jgi:hypothetical protein
MAISASPTIPASNSILTQQTINPSLLLPPLPPNNSRAKRPREQTRVISANHTLHTLKVEELEVANNSGKNSLQLDIRKLLADAAMPASAKRQVGRRGTLADNTVAVILGLLSDAFLDVLGGQADVLFGGLLVPAVGLPLQGLGEVLGDAAGDAGRGEEDVRGGDDPVGAFDGERVLDDAHNAVNGCVDAEGLLDDLSVKRQAAEVLVVEVFDRAVLVQSEDLLLLLEKVILDIGSGSKAEKNPADGGRRAVLAGHEQRDHHVGNLAVRHGLAVLVFAVHQVPDHVLLPVSGSGVARCTPFLDDVRVHLSHLLLSSITSAVVRQRQPAKLEVDGNKAAVEVMVELCEASVKSFADLLALERARGSVDGEFGEGRREVNGAVVGSETLGRRILVEESDGLGGNEFDIGAKGGGSQAKLDELVFVSAMFESSQLRLSYLLLLHELGVGAIVDHILAEHGGGERVVDLLGVDILQLAVENEVVALGSQTDGGLLAQKDKGEDIAVLFTAGEEEGIGVHAISDGVADPWQEVEDERWLVRVAEEDLLEDVQEDNERGQTGGGGEGDEPGGGVVEKGSQRANETLEETHCRRV